MIDRIVRDLQRGAAGEQAYPRSGVDRPMRRHKRRSCRPRKSPETLPYRRCRSADATERPGGRRRQVRSRPASSRTRQPRARARLRSTARALTHEGAPPTGPLSWRSSRSVRMSAMSRSRSLTSFSRHLSSARRRPERRVTRQQPQSGSRLQTWRRSGPTRCRRAKARRPVSSLVEHAAERPDVGRACPPARPRACSGLM